MTPTVRFPANLAAQRNIAKAQLTIEAHWDKGARLELLAKVHSEDNDGYPAGGNADGGSRSTDATSTVERAAEARVTLGVDSSTHHLACAIYAQSQAAYWLGVMTHHSRAYERPTRLPDERRAHVDTCLACGRVVEGGTADPIRRGMCTADYRRWERAGKPDITAFLHSTHVADPVAESVAS